MLTDGFDLRAGPNPRRGGRFRIEIVQATSCRIPAAQRLLYCFLRLLVRFKPYLTVGYRGKGSRLKYNPMRRIREAW